MPSLKSVPFVIYVHFSLFFKMRMKVGCPILQSKMWLKVSDNYEYNKTL